MFTCLRAALVTGEPDKDTLPDGVSEEGLAELQKGFKSVSKTITSYLWPENAWTHVEELSPFSLVLDGPGHQEGDYNQRHRPYCDLDNPRQPSETGEDL